MFSNFAVMNPSLIRENRSESEDQQRVRFQVELEFVQCLANPNYINFLAQRGYFKDSSFVNYIKYLQYWKDPQYAKYLKYPMCLHFLDLLQYEHFRKEVINGQCCRFIDDQQILHWQHYTRKRLKLLQSQSEKHLAGNSSSSIGTPTGTAASASLQQQSGNETGNVKSSIGN